MQETTTENKKTENCGCIWSGRTLKGKHIPKHRLDPIPSWNWKFVFSIRNGRRIPTLLRGVICGICHNYAESESIPLPEWMQEIPSVELLDTRVVHLRRDDDDEHGGVQ